MLLCSYEAFLAAAEKRDITAFEQFSDTDDHLDAKDSDGYTALHLAAANGHEDTVA